MHSHKAPLFYDKLIGVLYAGPLCLHYRDLPALGDNNSRTSPPASHSRSRTHQVAFPRFIFVPDFPIARQLDFVSSQILFTWKTILLFEEESSSYLV